jgi:hypothetical protein
MWDGRRLPCPVRPKQAKAFAGLDFEVQAAHGFEFAVVGLAQIAAVDGYGHWEILPDVVFAVVPRGQSQGCDEIVLAEL